MGEHGWVQHDETTPPGAADTAEEQATLVDPQGRVTGSAARSVVRRDNLRHAATAVLLRDSGRRIYVHRRAEDKDWQPGRHDAAAGGLLRWGEDPTASAERELAEELGVSGVPLVPLGPVAYDDDTVRVVEHCYEARWDGPVEHADGEVVWGAWMALPELGQLLADPTWPFVTDTRALLARLARERVHDYAELDG